MASSQIIRVTMFKVPKKEDQEVMLKNYEEVGRTNSKVSILSSTTRVPLYLLSFPEFICQSSKEYSQPIGQDGKPYILSLEAGPTYEDARNQGYTLVAKTVFKNIEDFEYYDKECQAHKEFKAKGKTLDVQGMMMVFFSPSVAASLE